MNSLLGRYAPSPTGNQHLGNVFIAVMAWAWPQKQGGRCALRIDDLDQPRVRAGSESQILAELHWLGLRFAPMPDQHAACRQSNRQNRYGSIHQQLRGQGCTYPSALSRKQWQAVLSAPHGEAEAVDVARELSRDGMANAPDQEHAWRFQAQGKAVRYRDGNLGDLESSVDDFVLWRRDGMAAYHLACVVDDHDLAVTQVLRGADLVPSTFRQLSLYRALGWPEPEHLHLPLIVTATGERLGKRHGLPGLAALKDRGIRPGQILGWVLSSLRQEPYKGRELSLTQLLNELPAPPWHQEPVMIPEAFR